MEWGQKSSQGNQWNAAESPEIDPICIWLIDFCQNCKGNSVGNRIVFLINDAGTIGH